MFLLRFTWTVFRVLVKLVSTLYLKTYNKYLDTNRVTKCNRKLVMFRCRNGRYATGGGWSAL